MDLGLVVVLICQGLLILLGMYLIWSWITQTPFYPSSTKKLSLIKDFVKLNKDDNFIDIGSGDGRIIIWAAKQGLQAEGIEFNPFLTLLTKLKIFINRLSSRAKVFNKDFNNHDYSKYNIAYLYIFREHMDLILPKLQKEMRPGSVIVTNTFKFSNLTPDKTIDRYNIYYIK